MGQVLRITFNNIDYNYQILNTSPVSKETVEIQILLDGAAFRFLRQQGQWLPEASDETPVKGLLPAIARALASRYRI